MNDLGTGTIFLASHKKGQTFEQSISEFIREATKTVQQRITEDELVEYSQTLAALYGQGVSYLYFTRKHRDEALGQAFLLYPKKQFNSEESIALSRAKASTEIRLHTLCKEILESIKVRLAVCRQQLQMRQLER